MLVSSKDQVRVVVGDRSVNFTQLPGVLKVSEVSRSARAGHLVTDDERLVPLVGQGVSAYSLSYLSDVLRQYGLEKRVELNTLLISDGARHSLCAEPEATSAGVLTGDVNNPMIGVAKGAAVRALMNHARVGPELCWAYADHANDLDLLNAVGHPRGWRRPSRGKYASHHDCFDRPPIRPVIGPSVASHVCRLRR